MTLPFAAEGREDRQVLALDRHFKMKTFSPQTAGIRQTLILTFNNFSRIDGDLRAAAFAYYAFFSLIPIIVILVMIGSFFVDRGNTIEAIIGYLQTFTPLNSEMKNDIFKALSGIVATRNEIGLVAFLILLWSALRLFAALTRAVNRAWGADFYNWWRLPLKNLLLLLVLTSALIIGIVMPIGLNVLISWGLPFLAMNSWSYLLLVSGIPFVVLFYALSLLYELAPRHYKEFRQVRTAAVITTVALLLLENLFALYINNFAKFNVIYGAFGGVVALLLWIYLSGAIIILGACFSAAQAQIKS